MDNIDWRSKYKNKEIKPEGLARIIQPGSRIFIGSGCSEPLILTGELIKKKWRYVDCEIIHFLSLSNSKFFDEKNPSLFRHICLFLGGPSIREAVNQGKADYVTIALSDIPRIFKLGRMHADVALIQVSPPDKFGFCSL
ncbi:MAG: hypothetical protein ACTSRX_06255, partial [Promethearchaeota archaeon]